MSTHNPQKSTRHPRKFKNREAYLEDQLITMNPRRWGINLPGRDYRFEVEDLIPALAGTIGKVVMTTAIVATWAAGYGLTEGFVVENVRFEMLIAAVLFVILFSGFLNPKANLAGCHGPLIPIIPLIVVAGGHPLALGIMVGFFGLILGFFKGGSTLVNLTGNGVRGGLLIYLGFVGLISQMDKLRAWTVSAGNEAIFLITILVTLGTYAYLVKINKTLASHPPLFPFCHRCRLSHGRSISICYHTWDATYEPLLLVGGRHGVDARLTNHFPLFGGAAICHLSCRYVATRLPRSSCVPGAKLSQRLRQGVDGCR